MGFEPRSWLKAREVDGADSVYIYGLGLLRALDLRWSKYSSRTAMHMHGGRLTIRLSIPVTNTVFAEVFKRPHALTQSIVHSAQVFRVKVSLNIHKYFQVIQFGR